jgi:N-methylhydantoinase B
MTVVDTIFKALAPAIPERVIAGHHADLLTANINGIHPRDGRLWLYLGGLIGGGWGAKCDEDGVNGTICMNDGDTHNGPSEQVENKFPLLVRSYQLRQDSGGAGHFRGGLGTEVEVEALAPINYMTRSDRVVNPPWGLAGGKHAKGNRIAIRRANGELTMFPGGKVDTRLQKGDCYIMSSGGGGGFGPPSARPLDALQADVRQGYVSLESAWSDYGVRFDAQTLELLELALERRATAGRSGPPEDR